LRPSGWGGFANTNYIKPVLGSFCFLAAIRGSPLSRK
jgi:hypothetical protein